MGGSINIEITESNGCKVIKTNRDGTKTNKEVTYGKLIAMLNAASYDEYTREEAEECILSDILPGDSIISTVQVKELPKSNSKWYIMLREGAPVDIDLKGKIFKNVAMPRTLFAIKVCNNKCASLRIGCIKDRFIKEDTPMYRYPYSNVFDTRNVCLGGNRINDFDLGTLSNLVMVPEMFLAMTNNHDGYNEANLSGFLYEDLLELLSGAKFDEEILRPSSNTATYQEFVNQLK